MLRRWDWTRILIPNNSFLSQEIQNLTRQDKYIWAHVEFYVSPDANLDQVKTIGLKAAQDSKSFMPSEPPSFWVMDLQPDAIKCWVAAWAETPDQAWELRNDIRTNLVLEFQDKGIQFQSQKHEIFKTT